MCLDCRFFVPSVNTITQKCLAVTEPGHELLVSEMVLLISMRLSVWCATFPGNESISAGAKIAPAATRVHKGHEFYVEGGQREQFHSPGIKTNYILF